MKGLVDTQTGSLDTSYFSRSAPPAIVNTHEAIETHSVAR